MGDTRKKGDKASPPLLAVEGLCVGYRPGRGIFARRPEKTAVEDVSFTIAPGRCLGLVGESGAGKTSAALAIARLIPARSGRVLLDGEDIMPLSGAALRGMRRRVQMIFQHPYAALNPRRRLGESVGEALRYCTRHDAAVRRHMVEDAFAEVGLGREHIDLFPHHLSGGQRQRVGIARALVTRPDLLICDEPVSALDTSVQAQILNLLRRLQQGLALACLFISHDPGVVRFMCDDIAVMREGRIVEYGAAERLFAAPRHPYTKTLLAARTALK